MLYRGCRLWGGGGDDNHNDYDIDSLYCDSFGCFTVVKARDRSQKSIIEALKSGSFYTSTGPEIYDFYVDEENEIAVLECSPAAKIRLHTDGHPTSIKRDADGNLTRAEFSIKSWCGKRRYVRMTVIDKDGRFAWTNPIFLD